MFSLIVGGFLVGFVGAALLAVFGIDCSDLE